MEQYSHTIRARLTPHGQHQNTTRCGSGGGKKKGSFATHERKAWSVREKVVAAVRGADLSGTPLSGSGLDSSFSIR